MTKHDLSRAEKKDLRKEVKEIKKELKATGNGIYLSVGAIIIIILLDKIYKNLFFESNVLKYF